jgi:hypothetical protein
LPLQWVELEGASGEVLSEAMGLSQVHQVDLVGASEEVWLKPGRLPFVQEERPLRGQTGHTPEKKALRTVRQVAVMHEAA